MKYLLYLLIYFIVGFLGAVFFYKKGSSFNLLDIPSERSSHSVPIPRGGGIGIWLSAVVISVSVLKSPIVALAIIFVGVIGFLGDSMSLSAKMRLVCYLVISGTVMLLLFTPIELSFLSISKFLLGVLLITWTLNLYNFMDGIDGVAAITAIVGFCLIAYFTYFVQKNIQISIASTYLMAACCGFLILNFPKAKVFMGDVGSVSLGFVFGILIIWLSNSFLDFICLCSFIIMFYVDEGTTMFVRVKNRENLMLPHRKHFYQLLVNEKGIEHWKVALLYGGLQLFAGVSVIMLRDNGIFAILTFLCIFLAILISGNYVVRKKHSNKVNYV